MGGPIRRVDVPRLRSVAAWGIGAALVLTFFDAFRSVALLLLAAAALSATLRPAAEWLPARRSVATLALVGAVVIALGAGLVGVGWAVAPRVRRELRQLPHLEERIDAQLREWSAALGVDPPLTTDAFRDEGLGFFGGQSVPGVLGATADTLTTAGVALAVLVFGTIFLTAERPGRLTDPAIALLPAPWRGPARGVRRDLPPRLRRWVLGTGASMLIVGVASTVGYRLVGLEPAVPVGVLSGLLEIVPFLGPILGLVVALLVAATQGTEVVVGVLCAYAAVQTLESWVIVPLVMRRAVRVPPAVTLFTTILWGRLLGPVGLILAVPINLVIWTLAEHASGLAETPPPPPPDAKRSPTGAPPDGAGDGDPDRPPPRAGHPRPLTTAAEPAATHQPLPQAPATA